MAKIDTNVYAGETTWIVVILVGGSPLLSRSFKSERGALTWAHTKVMR